jgi:tryptophan-rich sensory protein
MFDFKLFAKTILVPVLVGAIVGILISGSIDYDSLEKPFLAPPSSAFPIVWTILYILMGISAYKILKKGSDLSKVKDAMFYYWLQLGLNFVWSILFFGLGLRFTALVDLILLVIVVTIMIYKFYKLDKKAAYLNIPYIIWLLYAAVLNYFVWMINR